MSSAAPPASSLAAPPFVSVASATGVAAQLVLAGPGARAIAFVLDFLIRSCLALAWLLLAAWLILGNLEFDIPQDRETLWYLAGVVPATAIYFLYHLVLEPLMDGRTPGKRMTGLRVVTQDGVVPGVGALLTRNLFRIIDSLPALYVVGLLFVMFGRRHVRLGDLAAGTVLAVERAHFLEKLAERHGARELGTARDARGNAIPARLEHLEATYSELHGSVHRPARRTWLVLWSLLRDQVPAAVYAMRWHMLAVTLLFVISTAAGFSLIYSFPDLIAMFASPQLIATVERGDLWTDGLLNVTPSAVLSVSILTNNIVVSLFAFCSGIVFALGTFYIVGLNGFSLGAIFAFTAQHGLAGRLFDFVVAHGCVELSCICISGAAGSYLGEALIRPGTHTRSEAFHLAARDGIRVLAVVTLLLFICGFIEGYVSPDPEIPRWARVTIGLGYWVFMISLLRGYVFGRSRGGAGVPV
jgi:uncharacterized membrane protein SpoIIM required for sporulation/uncharacterized RDD family membrane protein YckC